MPSGLDLLQPRIRSRQSILAQTLTLVLLVVAVLDVVAALATSSLAVRTAVVQSSIAAAKNATRSADLAAASAERLGRQATGVQRQLSALAAVPSPAAFELGAASLVGRRTPAGVTVQTLSVAATGETVVTGTAQTFAQVEQIQSALGGQGGFGFVEVVSAARAATGGGVDFQLEAWPAGAPASGGANP